MVQQSQEPVNGRTAERRLERSTGRPKERGGAVRTVAPELEFRRRSFGQVHQIFFYDPIFTLYHIICVSNNVIFPLNSLYLKPYTSINIKTPFFFINNNSVVYF